MKTLLALAALLLTACNAAAMTLTSSDIIDGQPIPRANYYTHCSGQNIAPALSWSGAPENTESFAVTVIDRSVRPNGWSHWIVLHIPANVHALPRGGALPAGASGVVSDFGDATYNGPCPPAGSGVHRYEFTVYAFAGHAFTLPPHVSAKQIEELLSTAASAKTTSTVTAQMP